MTNSLIRILLATTLLSCVTDELDTVSVSQEAALPQAGLTIVAPDHGTPTSTNYALYVLNSLATGAANYGIQVKNEASNNGPKFALHAVANGANGTNYGLLVGASNGGNNVALKTNHGDVILNADSGLFRANRNTTLGSTNDHTRTSWGHGSIRGTAPNLACGTGATVVGTDSRGVVRIGFDATACAITFSRPYARETTCTVTARDGEPFQYDVTGTQLALAAVSPGAAYDYSCDCVGGGGCL